MIVDRAARERFRVTLMLFDVDDFKGWNDRHGHAAGDEVLTETVRLLRTVVRKTDVVARVGGDEFAVVFWDAQPPRGPLTDHPREPAVLAERFQDALRRHSFPRLAGLPSGALSISGGLATFPWDGHTPERLIELADARARESKARGKGRITLGPAPSPSPDSPDSSHASDGPQGIDS
jgi:diguanylate cyclase (GGDEF)-like protein